MSILTPSAFKDLRSKKRLVKISEIDITLYLIGMGSRRDFSAQVNGFPSEEGGTPIEKTFMLLLPFDPEFEFSEDAPTFADAFPIPYDPLADIEAQIEVP